ncbi:nucleoside deaminase [Alcaligenaceae bacterium]|nr:nucleoside deaminase [Alcaligenaceae bacterium]
MTADDRYIRAAIDLAYKNVDAGGRPFGSVVVRNGQIVSEAANESHLCGDPTAHAEFLAVKRAGIALGTRDLSDCVVYASGQPCPFCMATMSLYGIRKTFYGYTREEWRKVTVPLDYAPVDAQVLSPGDDAPLYAYWKQQQDAG